MNCQKNRYSQYRTMWILVFYDLPTETNRQIKQNTAFRDKLIQDGFEMFQYSIYIRHCESVQNADVHIKRVKNAMPEYGYVAILKITDKQFAKIEAYNNKREENINENQNLLFNFDQCEFL